MKRIRIKMGSYIWSTATKRRYDIHDDYTSYSIYQRIFFYKVFGGEKKDRLIIGMSKSNIRAIVIKQQINNHLIIDSSND